MVRRTPRWSIAMLAALLSLVAHYAPAQDAPPASASTTPEPAPATPEPPATKKPAARKPPPFPRVTRTDRQWRARLQPNQYSVARRKGTEPAFSGIYWNHHDDGVYVCVCCGTPMFDSEAKFDSGTGWPSYWRPIDRVFLQTKPDLTDGTVRTEVNCKVCDAHLGHIFNDGPAPTGLRFCINSSSIGFIPRGAIDDHVERWREAVGLPPIRPEAEPVPPPATPPAEPAATEKPAPVAPEPASSPPGR